MSSPRNRIINFRLTEEEFEQLKTACQTQGGRCISEFARQSVLASAASEESPIATRLATLDERLASLDARIERVLSELKIEA